MNFEQLNKLLRRAPQPWWNDRKFIRLYVYFFDTIMLNRRRLKLGKMAIELVDVVVDGFKIWEYIETRFSRQDNTAEIERRLDTRLEALNWKWDFPHVMAFIIISVLIIILICAYFWMLYCNHLPAIAYKDPRFKILLNYVFTDLFDVNLNLSFVVIKTVHSWAFSILADACIFFDLVA